MASQNIEFKARTSRTQWLNLSLLQKFTQTKGLSIVHQVSDQEDTFFQNLTGGRLKLRVINKANGELIYYERPDLAEAKLSNFWIAKLGDSYRSVLHILEKSNNILGVVKKRRIVAIAQNVRVHFDHVENLGSFIEVEVVVSPEHPEEECRKTAKEFMQCLEIREEDLVSKSYFDLLREKKRKQITDMIKKKEDSEGWIDLSLPDAF